MKNYQKILVLVLLTIAPFLLAELTLGLAGYQQEFPYRDDPTLGYALREGYQGPGAELYNIPRKIDIAVNEHGFRGKAITTKKPPNVKRIVLLGDSCTFGLGLKHEETFATLTEDILNQEARADQRIEVINTGVPGYTSYQGLQMLKERVLDLKPDMITIYFGWNDHWFSDRGLPDHENYPKMRPLIEEKMQQHQNNPFRHSKLYAWLSDTLLRLQDTAKHQAVKPNPENKVYRVSVEHYAANLKEMIQIARKNGIPALVITPPHGFVRNQIPKDYLVENLMKRDNTLIELHEEYIKATRDATKEAGGILVDMAAFFDEIGRLKFMEPDGIHPNAKGHRIIARELSKKIKEIEALQFLQRSQASNLETTTTKP